MTDSLDPGTSPVPAPSLRHRRSLPAPATVLFLTSSALLTALFILLAFLPVPFAVRGPGPTLDTIGGDPPLITVVGAPTFPTGEGELRLTTVTVSGGPDEGIPLFDALLGWLRSDSTVVTRSEQFPPGQDQQELSDYQIAQMNASQQNATAAALQELGYELDMTITVAELMPDFPPATLLEVGDVLKVITAAGQRTELETFGQLTGRLAELPAGTEVELEVERAGKLVPVTFPTSARPAGDDRPGSVLGVWVFTEVTEFPVTVSFDIDRIGGPSAGMMFALGIVDLLTEGEMTGGVNIAGTGTMSVDGQVGPIGGIMQKVYGAKRDGATWFLAPVTNCRDLAGGTPDGIGVVPVATLEEAIVAVAAIAAGEGDTLPACPAP